MYVQSVYAMCSPCVWLYAMCSPCVHRVYPLCDRRCPQRAAYAGGPAAHVAPACVCTVSLCVCLYPVCTPCALCPQRAAYAPVELLRASRPRVCVLYPSMCVYPVCTPCVTAAAPSAPPTPRWTCCACRAHVCVYCIPLCVSVHRVYPMCTPCALCPSAPPTPRWSCCAHRARVCVYCIPLCVSVPRVYPVCPLPPARRLRPGGAAARVAPAVVRRRLPAGLLRVPQVPARPARRAGAGVTPRRTAVAVHQSWYVTK